MKQATIQPRNCWEPTLQTALATIVSVHAYTIPSEYAYTNNASSSKFTRFNPYFSIIISNKSQPILK